MSRNLNTELLVSNAMRNKMFYISVCSVFDVGGQRGERRRWIQVFETITAILFVVDCSCFDAALREDPTRNRLVEAVATFEQTWNSK